MGMFDGMRAMLMGGDFGQVGSPIAANGPIMAGELSDPSSVSFSAITGAGSTRAGTRVPMNEAKAMGLPAVMRAAEVLTGVFAMTPMIYYQRVGQGKERASSSPLYRLFHDRPNAVQSPFLFKEILLGDMLFAGGAGLFIHRDGLFQPSQLSRLNPRAIVPAEYWSAADGPEVFYDASLPDGSRRRLNRSECWYVPGFSRNGVMGVDRLRLMDDALAGAASAGEYARHFFENYAQPATLITAKTKMSDEVRSAFRQAWKSMFGGPRRAGDVAILDQEMDAKALGASNRDSQFVEVRQLNVVEVARAFGVPPHLLFELSRATFSNIEHQSLEFIIYSMMPHYERVASAATHAFAEPGHFFEFMPDALLKGDVKTRWEAYKAARESGVLSADEIRERENMNLIGGDAGSERWRPANMAVSGQPNPSAAPAQ